MSGISRNRFCRQASVVCVAGTEPCVRQTAWKPIALQPDTVPPFRSVVRSHHCDEWVNRPEVHLREFHSQDGRCPPVRGDSRIRKYGSPLTANPSPLTLCPSRFRFAIVSQTPQPSSPAPHAKCPTCSPHVANRSQRHAPLRLSPPHPSPARQRTVPPLAPNPYPAHYQPP